MNNRIQLAPRLSTMFESSGELLGVKPLMVYGPVSEMDGVKVRSYAYRILLRSGEGYFVYYRLPVRPYKIVRLEYKGPAPHSFYQDGEVHLVSVNGERKDRFTDIEFP